MSVHTIYVPPGWSLEQTCEAIKRGDKVPATPGGKWHNVDGSKVGR